MMLLVVEGAGGMLGDRVGRYARAAVAIEALDELRKLLGVILFLVGQPSQAYGPTA